MDLNNGMPNKYIGPRLKMGSKLAQWCTIVSDAQLDAAHQNPELSIICTVNIIVTENCHYRCPNLPANRTFLRAALKPKAGQIPGSYSDPRILF